MRRDRIVAACVALSSAVALAIALRQTHGRRGSSAEPAAAPASASHPLGPDSYSVRTIGRLPEGIPWITDVEIVDLDRDGLKDILACDARLNRVCWIRQVRKGVFEEREIGGPVPGPAHVSVADMDGTGHLDVLVACMGQIMPNNDKIGSVVLLQNDGHEHFTNRILQDHTYRVTDVEAADLNGDGKLDLAVAQFGYLEGQVEWLENLGGGRFRSHPLLDLAGTIHAPVADLTGGGHRDIVALVAQDSQEVHLLAGDGRGSFRDRVLYGSTNKAFGSSGLCVADVNGDGRPDIVYTNGDGFDFATPGTRPWHGVQWLENLGGGKFAYHRLGDLAGAFSPVVADLNGDGHPDILVCSGFNDWKDPGAISLLCFEGDGANHFTPRVLGYLPNHVIVVRAGDLYNDGRIELVTGAFMLWPPFDHPSRVTLWEPRK